MERKHYALLVTCGQLVTSSYVNSIERERYYAIVIQWHLPNLTSWWQRR